MGGMGGMGGMGSGTGFPMAGGGAGMLGSVDPAQMMQMLQNPAMQQMATALMQDPQALQSLQQMVQSTVGGGDPGSYMQHMQQVMSNPAVMPAVMQMMQDPQMQQVMFQQMGNLASSGGLGASPMGGFGPALLGMGGFPPAGGVSSCRAILCPRTACIVGTCTCTCNICMPNTLPSHALTHAHTYTHIHARTRAHFLGAMGTTPATPAAPPVSPTAPPTAPVAPQQPAPTPPAPPAADFNAMLTNVLTNMNPPPAGTTVANTAATVAPEIRYASQISQLCDMGFFDADANLRALTATGGNVNAAVERLLSGV